jgi:hypothetical protein
MSKKLKAIVVALMFGLLAGGCAQNTANESRNNATYDTTMHLTFQPDFADRSFSSGKDYSLSIGFNGVTYIWPEGKGNFSKMSNEINFEGKNIKCTVVKRRLTINGRRIADFEEGDRVRVTGDGEVFVNGKKLDSPGDN